MVDELAPDHSHVGERLRGTILILEHLDVEEEEEEEEESYNHISESHIYNDLIKRSRLR